MNSLRSLPVLSFILLAAACSSTDDDSGSDHQNVTVDSTKLNASDSQALIDLLDKAGVAATNGVAGPSWKTQVACTLVSGVNASCAFGAKGTLFGADANHVLDLLEKVGIKSTAVATGMRWDADAACSLVNGKTATCSLTAPTNDQTTAAEPVSSLPGEASEKLIDLLEKAGVGSVQGNAGPSWSATISCNLVNGANAICNVGPTAATLRDADAEQMIDLLEDAGIESKDGVAGPTWTARASCTLVSGKNASCRVS